MKKKERIAAPPKASGAEGEIRTLDLRITNALLCQLSYFSSHPGTHGSRNGGNFITSLSWLSRPFQQFAPNKQGNLFGALGVCNMSPCYKGKE